MSVGAYEREWCGKICTDPQKAVEQARLDEEREDALYARTALQRRLFDDIPVLPAARDHS